MFNGLFGIVQYVLDLIYTHHLVKLFEAVVAHLKTAHDFLLDLRELERVYHLIDVVQLLIGFKQIVLIESLLLEQ